MDTITTLVVLLATLTTAATGGAYLAFSAMVMPALHQLPAATETMNRINRRAPRSSFIAVFLGSAALCAVAIVLVFGRLPAPEAVLALAGGIAGVAGFVLTATVNVPLNNHLAAAAGTDASAFSAFEARWRRANTARCVLSLAGAAALGAALVV